MPAAIPSYQIIAQNPAAFHELLLAANGGMLPGTLELDVAFGTADAAVLFTVPAGFRMLITKTYWEPSVAWTGGASSAIGLSSSNPGYATKGDLLGGAGGDVAAGLTVVAATPCKGTIGAKLASGGTVVLIAGDTIRFDRIVSAFTAGAAKVHIHYQLVPTA